MKFTIGSLVISATMLVAVTSSSAQTATSAATSVVPVQTSTQLLVTRASTQDLLRGSSSEAPSTFDGVLMLALGVSLVAIQLRRRQKSFRAPLLRT